MASAGVLTGPLEDSETRRGGPELALEPLLLREETGASSLAADPLPFPGGAFGCSRAIVVARLSKSKTLPPLDFAKKCAGTACVTGEAEGDLPLAFCEFETDFVLDFPEMLL